MAIARAEAPLCTNVGAIDSLEKKCPDFFLQILMAENCQDTFEVAEKATDAIAIQAGCWLNTWLSLAATFVENSSGLC